MRKKFTIGCLLIVTVVMLLGCTKEKRFAERERASLDTEPEANMKTITSQINSTMSVFRPASYAYSLLLYQGSLYRCYHTIQVDGEKNSLKPLGIVYGYGSSACFSDTELEAEQQYEAELFRFDGVSEKSVLAVRYADDQGMGEALNTEQIDVFVLSDIGKAESAKELYSDYMDLDACIKIGCSASGDSKEILIEDSGEVKKIIREILASDFLKDETDNGFSSEYYFLNFYLENGCILKLTLYGCDGGIGFCSYDENKYFMALPRTFKVIKEMLNGEGERYEKNSSMENAENIF